MDVLRLELGGEFREFWQKSGYTPEKAAALAESGSLQPEFLAINMWSQMLINFFNDKKHLLADGVPRTLREAKVLDGTLRFYNIERPTVVYLHLDREVARERMISRGRSDDDTAAIENRLDWFEKDVTRTIDFLQDENYYQFLRIDANRTIEEIHAEIMERVNL